MDYKIREHDMRCILRAIESAKVKGDDLNRNYVELAGRAMGTLRFIQEILTASIKNAAE